MKSKSTVENESRRCPGAQDKVRVAWGPGFGWATGMAGGRRRQECDRSGEPGKIKLRLRGTQRVPGCHVGDVARS